MRSTVGKWRPRDPTDCLTPKPQGGHRRVMGFGPRKAGFESWDLRLAMSLQESFLFQLLALK